MSTTAETSIGTRKCLECAAEIGHKAWCSFAASTGSPACDNHWWPGAVHGQEDTCSKCGWTVKYYGDGFGGINHGVWVAHEAAERAHQPRRKGLT